jgi:hypothetical protein
MVFEPIKRAPGRSPEHMEGFLDAVRGYPLPKGAKGDYRTGWVNHHKAREEESNK